MIHKKDCYHVVTPSAHAGYIVIGARLIMVPANRYQVFSLHAGPEYAELVYDQYVTKEQLQKWRWHD